MKSFIDKTVGGLSPVYYIRHFLFVLIIPAVLIYAHRHAGGKGVDPKEYGFFVNTLLYPYARFLYERITSYIIGNNIFITTPLALLFRKAVSMVICWCLAIVMAPAGMLCLWYLHTRREREAGRQLLSGLGSGEIIKKN